MSTITSETCGPGFPSHVWVRGLGGDVCGGCGATRPCCSASAQLSTERQAREAAESDAENLAHRLVTTLNRAEAAEKEVERLTAEKRLLQEILDSRPAINAALPDSYIRWSHAIYSGDALRAISALPPPVPTEEGGELRPCPFCGSEPVVGTYETESLFSHDIVPNLSISCHSCDCALICGEQFDEVRAAWNRRPTQAPQDVAPIPMLLFCPNCGVQHVDEADERTPGWTNPPHRSHLCDACGCIWRPADLPTEGVEAIASKGQADTWSPTCPHYAPGPQDVAGLVEGDELADLISDAISDSMDMDWSSRDGARAVVAALVKENIVRIKS